MAAAFDLSRLLAGAAQARGGRGHASRSAALRRGRLVTARPVCGVLLRRRCGALLAAFRCAGAAPCPAHARAIGNRDLRLSKCRRSAPSARWAWQATVNAAATRRRLLSSSAMQLPALGASIDCRDRRHPRRRREAATPPIGDRDASAGARAHSRGSPPQLPEAARPSRSFSPTRAVARQARREAPARRHRALLGGGGKTLADCMGFWDRGGRT